MGSKKRTWEIDQLKLAIKESFSFRPTLEKIKLQPSGGNYEQIKKYIEEFNLDISHFKGKGWNKGISSPYTPRIPLWKILTENSHFQSYKLKNRLLRENLKKPRCEECGWSKKTSDGRLPLELHHLNENRYDNRLENLILLCPNCHSLKPHYRGRNRKK